MLVTDDQMAGRGRLGRRVDRPAPLARCAVSVLLRRPRRSTGRWSWLPLLAGVAVVDALTRTCGLPARLKWPNDVLVPVGGLAGRAAAARCAASSPRWSRRRPVRPWCSGPGINVSQDAARTAGGDRDLAAAGRLGDHRPGHRAARLPARAGRAATGPGGEAGGDPRASGIAARLPRGVRHASASTVAVQLPAADPVAGVGRGGGRRRAAARRDADGSVSALAAGDVVHVRPPV